MTRKRGRLVLVGMALVGVAFVGAAIWFMEDDKGGQEAQAALFLARIVDGKTNDAYDSAAPRLREAMQRVELEELANDLYPVTGRFRKLQKIKVHANSLTADALFEKATIGVGFDFERIDSIWRVAAFELSFPDGLWPAPEHAPLLEEAAAFGDAFVAGDLAKMYARFTPSMHKALKPSMFEGDIQKLRGGCASMAIGKPGVLSEEKGLTIVAASVLCEPRGTFILRTKWAYTRGKWRLLGINWSE